MKQIIQFNRGFSRPLRWLSTASAAVVAFANPLLAAGVTLGQSNGIGASSFDSALSWSDGLAPAAGNAYIVPSLFNLRTPADQALDYIFAGDSLILGSGASLIYKGITNVNTITIPSLVLDGAIINNASNSSTPFILAGDIEIAEGATSTILANNAAITVSATIRGASGKLVLQSNDVIGRQVILTGANTFTGDLEIIGASGAVLEATSTIAFVIGPDGVNNSVVGTAPVTFNGAFEIDLTNAGDLIGESWILVNVASLNETFGLDFSINGFTKNTTFWTSVSGKYQFNETTGILKRIGPDSEGDGLPDAWEMLHFENLDEVALGDFDQDFATNLMEYEAGTDPDDRLSYPDTDNDGLNDGWELVFFNNLNQNGDDDPDLDFSNNAAEFAADTFPTNRDSFPATDDGVGDGISDGWEVYYFGSIAACDPYVDSDGDLFSNIEEFLDRTDPKEQTSSPDTDGDGLPDGWEVKYFRIGGESLSEVILKQGAGDDPDLDGYSNLMEFNRGTDPVSAASSPFALAYWRFEEQTSGVVPYGNDTGGNQPDVVLDESGLNNHLMTWRNYTAPTYTTEVPYPIVPLTSAPNTASLLFTRDGGNLFVTDNIYTSAGALLNNHEFKAFTIEANFRTNVANAWQVVIGKTGNPIGGQPPFSLKIRASDNRLVAGIVDGAGTAKEAVSDRAVTAGVWYAAAVTASATELKLWLKDATDSDYQLEATTAIGGAYFTYAGNNSNWVVGLGKWNSADADPFGGNIDEVRISPKVLVPSEFLLPSTFVDTDNDGMDDAWERDYFKSLDESEFGDFDMDGTPNLAEYLLGLVPNDGSSFFAIDFAGNALSWQAAPGLTFTIQRSTSLAIGGWSDVASVVATGSTASWTDPSPPAGNRFYRVLLPLD